MLFTAGVTALLVFSNRHEVRGIELPTLTVRALISSLKNTISLDWRREPSGAVRLYWTDVVDDNIYSGLIVENGGFTAPRLYGEARGWVVIKVAAWCASSAEQRHGGRATGAVHGGGARRRLGRREPLLGREQPSSDRSKHFNTVPVTE